MLRAVFRGLWVQIPRNVEKIFLAENWLCWVHFYIAGCKTTPQKGHQFFSDSCKSPQRKFLATVKTLNMLVMSSIRHALTGGMKHKTTMVQVQDTLV
jgi:hypothetical protein